MPNGTVKNTLYSLAMPILGKKCDWKPVDPIGRIYHHYHTVGACFQPIHQYVFEKAQCYGYRNPECHEPVTERTWFRIASLTKTAVAFLVMRMQTLKMLDVQEDIGSFWDKPIRNPHFPKEPITLGMLLSHTSSLCDSAAYFSSYNKNICLHELLEASASFSFCKPGTCFTYSNFGAGMAASLLEYRFGKSIEQLIQEFLFIPLGIKATFDASLLRNETVADLWRVLPQKRCYDAKMRCNSAKPITEADPEHHYLLAAGQLMITAPMLGKLCSVLFQNSSFFDTRSISCLTTPGLSWPDRRVPMRHAMGLFTMELPSGEVLFGHQGLAYGAVNGLFFNKHGDGFVSLTAGTSEQRIGHLCAVNQALLHNYFTRENIP